MFFVDNNFYRNNQTFSRERFMRLEKRCLRGSATNPHPEKVYIIQVRKKLVRWKFSRKDRERDNINIPMDQATFLVLFSGARLDSDSVSIADSASPT